MKKLLLIASLIVMGSASASAQATPTVVTDTVHYFFNKFYFKTGTKMENFQFYKSPAATATSISHVGSKFENNEPIEIKGLEAFVTRHASSTKLTIPVHLYLCTLENNLPKLPPIDSVMLSISGPQTFVGAVGKDFPNGRTHVLTGDFAVLARNMSLSSGDTLRIMRTAGKTFTFDFVGYDEKNSDGFGYLRYQGQFYSATNYTTGGGSKWPYDKNGFGLGTDYEFCIAPRVQYTLTADHAVDPIATNLNVYQPMTVTNLSSKRFLHRQYNLVEFARKWNYFPPFHPNTLVINTVNGPENVFPADSSIGWYFAPEDNLQDRPHPRFFLPYNTTTNQMSFYTDSSRTDVFGNDSLTCFTTNEFRTRFKAMAIYGRGTYLMYNDTFIICTKFNGTVGNKDLSGFNTVRVFPNPTNGRSVISGLNAGTEVRLYNMTGQLISSQKAISDRAEVDLSAQPQGAYFLKLSDGERQRTLRFIKQ
jgi:hypothetical protein